MGSKSEVDLCALKNGLVNLKGHVFEGSDELDAQHKVREIDMLENCQSFNILIADDNRDNLMVLNAVLSRVGFNVMQAMSAK